MTNVIFFFKVGHRSKFFCMSGKPLSQRTRNLHAKYEGSIWKGSKHMTNVKVVQQTNKETGQKHYVQYRYWGHKKSHNSLHFDTKDDQVVSKNSKIWDSLINRLYVYYNSFFFFFIAICVLFNSVKRLHKYINFFFMSYLSICSCQKWIKYHMI